MGFFNDIVEFFDLNGEQERERKKQAKQKKLNDYSLTCRRCGDQAKPIENTPNRYECKCGNKFAGAKHPF